MNNTLSDKQALMRQRHAARQERWTPGATKLTEQDREYIRMMYQTGRATQTELAARFDVAQSLIHVIIKRAGMAHHRTPAEMRTCAQCGAAVNVSGPRKNTKRSFCSRACFHAYIHNPEYQRSVWGTKLARQKVSKYFNLTQFNVVHHADFNDNNNNLSNLWVFEDQSAHLSYHRGGDAEPIWKGSSVR
jgi:hypothetical protein